MILLVDLEHERLRADETLWRYFAANTLQTKYRLEDISGEHCLILDYRRATPSVLEELNPRALVVGGNYTGFQHFDEKDLAGLKQIFIQMPRPILAVCGGFQLMAKVHGGQLGLMGPCGFHATDYPTDTDTPLPEALSSPESGVVRNDGSIERGYLPVRVAAAHPLFSGMFGTPVFYQLHGGEVKHLPDIFSILAESESCKIQAVAHKHAPVFGVQFHPEQFDETHPDGKRLLENFFSIAGM